MADSNSDCIFCKIVKGDAPASVVLESEKAIAFESIDPVASTHVLIVPKKHIETFMDVGDQDRAAFSEMIEVAQAAVKKEKIDEGYKLVFNGGQYQAISHLHWHLLGGELEEAAVKQT